MKFLTRITAFVMLVGMVACGGGSTDNKSTVAGDSTPNTPKEPVYLYGIDTNNHNVANDTVRSGETVGGILNRCGVSAVMVDRLDKAAVEVFPLRKIRADKPYTKFTHTVSDSLGEREVLDYLVYHIDAIEYVTFGFVGDSVSVVKGENPVEVVRERREAVINSSLWGAIMEQNMPYSLAAEVEDIYQWTVDFFGIQHGDSFTVIYDEKYVNGESLRKQMLKAPLKYTRISSKFSNARLHPVHKVYRPHHGVDYAAPSGTPVHSVADGTVIFAGWGGGGGNTIKIKHAGGLQTGYLHLKGFAKGIKVGTKVSQGQLIGYVGSTGTSTGPHLDYRIWKNGTPIDPLKVTQEPAEPIAVAHKERFEAIRDRVMAELAGNEVAGGPITDEDIFVEGK